MPLETGCISRADLRAAAVYALTGAATVVGSSVYDLHSQPIDLNALPLLVVSTPSERKETAGEGAPQFFTTMTLAVVARVAPGSEHQAEAQLDQLVDQVQEALLSTIDMVNTVQRFTYVETQSIVSAEGEQFVGEATIIFGCEVYQQYWPTPVTPLTGFITTVRQPGGAEFEIDSPVAQ